MRKENIIEQEYEEQLDPSYDITQDELDEYKKKWWNLYYVDMEDYEFLYRELSRGEYKYIIRQFTDENGELLTDEAEEYICKLCVLRPKDFDFNECPAGIPMELAKQILHESGLDDDLTKFTDYLTLYRKEMETFDNQISCIICEAFPYLQLEEVENWPLEKTLWYFSRAEYSLNSLRGWGINFFQNNNEIVKEQPKSNNITTQPGVVFGENSNKGDFPELAAMEAFMKGKL